MESEEELEEEWRRGGGGVEERRRRSGGVVEEEVEEERLSIFPNIMEINQHCILAVTHVVIAMLFLENMDSPEFCRVNIVLTSTSGKVRCLCTSS